jgi:outer membrane protein
MPINMKKTILTLAVVLLGLSAQAQRFAYVDTEYILENIPEYKTKQGQLDELSVGWQAEIETMYATIDKLYKDFQAEQILLTEEMKRKRQDQIIEKEKEARAKQKQRFGPDGDLHRKRQEFVKPIQDKVYRAIKDVAAARGYSVIFDKSGSLTMLYTDVKYDISDQILQEMGFSAKESKDSKDSKTGSGTGTGGGKTDGNSGSDKK